MKSLPTLAFSLLVLLSMSCEKPDGKYIESVIEITVVNQQGQNLLAAPATYSEKDISIYSLVNGQPQVYDNSHFPNVKDFNDKGFEITHEGTSRVRIYLNFDVNRKDTHPVILVKFGTSNVDTINTAYEYIGRSVFLRKVWFNGIEKKREFSIVK